MKKSGTNTRSSKTQNKPQTPKTKETNPKAAPAPAPQTLTQEEKELTIQLIDTAVYYNDYMLTDFDRKIIAEIKRKIWK